jgi:lipopolysaccharide/colanic/teichoic acid biosynthesis glycosyltransferase
MDRYWRRVRVGVLITDGLGMLAAYGVVTFSRFGFSALVPQAGVPFPAYPPLIIGVTLLTLVLGWKLGVYKRWALVSGHRVYPLLLTVATYGVVAVIILSYLVQASPFMVREWLAGSWLLSVGLLMASHLVWRQVALGWRREGLLVRRVLIAGANQQGIAVAHQLNDPQRHGTQVVGFLDDYQRPGTQVVDGLTVVGHPGAVLEQARELRADEVVIIAGALAWDSQRMLAEMVTRPDAPIEARISPTYYDLLTTSAELSEVGYVPMLTLHRTRLSGVNAFAKATGDRLIAGALLVLLSPGWLYWRVKAFVRRRPMLERQPVLGLEGRAFDVFALNPSLTRSPVLARLPALANVWRQQLSLVGPRPIRATEVPTHERWLANLFAMRPGLTGFWRLRGEELSLEERVALDLYYVRNYTPNLDLQILYRTANQLVRRWLGREHGLARWEREEGGRVRRPGPAVDRGAQEARLRDSSVEPPARVAEAERDVAGEVKDERTV